MKSQKVDTPIHFESQNGSKYILLVKSREKSKKKNLLKYRISFTGLCVTVCSGVPVLQFPGSGNVV